MGIQDRDYYWEHRDKLERQAGESAAPSPRRPILSRFASRPAPVSSPPPLIGADWHWSLKLLVWLVIAVLLLLAAQAFRGMGQRPMVDRRSSDAARVDPPVVEACPPGWGHGTIEADRGGRIERRVICVAPVQ